MRLADFILSNIEPILAEWEVFARSITAGAGMSSLALRDDAHSILHATAQDMKSSQTAAERCDKSKGGDRHGEDNIALNDASDRHAVERLGAGFDLLEVGSEYRALRASVLRLWRDSKPAAHDCDVDDITRFNESIDQSLSKALRSYSKRVEQSRDMFLAILSHDLRNPLNSISMSAAVLPMLGQPVPEAIGCASQIVTSAQVMGRMIGDLLDYTRTRLGAGMPVVPVPTNLGALGRELCDEFRAAHPQRTIYLQTDGDLKGNWDADRLRQAISNLLGNAIQHSRTEIDLALTGEASGVVIIVHNGGPPIPAGELPRIFEPLVRGSSAEHPPKHRPGSIGLGLYIAREIARSHGGSLVVTSTAEAGTAFTLRLPRHSAAKAGQPDLAPILDEKHIETM